MEIVPLASVSDSTDLRMADGVFCKTLRVIMANTVIPQHAHAYDHVSVIVRGSVHLWQDGEDRGCHHAPVGILIEARSKHLFQTLEDDTIILCVHDIGTAEDVEIVEEHSLIV
jgi:quercetin dioxygenase-like cupin family protein